MDMDPCVVASRAEIVAQKVDLTASEHAGVALSEVTTLVSGRDYPKAATMEPSNGGTQNRQGAYQPKWCKVCKISCNGDIAFDTHIEGKQHQRNLKFTEKTPTLYVKIMEESKSVVGNGNGNGITWCEICKISCATNIYAKHASGKKHMKNLQNLDKIPNLLSTVTDSASPHEGKDVNPIKINSTSCELCGISCTSLELLNTHIAGKKHQKKLKKSEKQCAPELKTPLPEPMNEEGKTAILEGSKRKADDTLSSDEDADTKKQKTNEEESYGVLVSCKVCDVSCTGFTTFQNHLASVEHSAMVQKQAEGGSDGLQV